MQTLGYNYRLTDFQAALGASQLKRLYVIETDQRKELYDFLHANNVMPQVQSVPVNSMPYYRSLGFKPEDTPNALRYYQRCLSLPLYPSMTDQDVEVVIKLTRLLFVDN